MVHIASRTSTSLPFLCIILSLALCTTSVEFRHLDLLHSTFYAVVMPLFKVQHQLRCNINYVTSKSSIQHSLYSMLQFLCYNKVSLMSFSFITPSLMTNDFIFTTFTGWLSSHSSSYKLYCGTNP